jgi:hypothetical protein
MTCPSCQGELSKIWRPQGSSKDLTIPHVQWGCGICGQTFSREQLRPPKEQVKVEPLAPILL